VATEGQPADSHVDVLGDVNVDVAEADEYGQEGPTAVDLGLAQIEIEVAETRRRRPSSAGAGAARA
jgi:hypothetical protein